MEKDIQEQKDTEKGRDRRKDRQAVMQRDRQRHRQTRIHATCKDRQTDRQTEGKNSRIVELGPVWTKASPCYPTNTKREYWTGGG